MTDTEWKIPLFKIYWDNADIKQVADVIKRGNYWATGPEIKAFEDKISEYVKKRYAVTFNTGTSALHAILNAFKIKTNDEVIVPSFTFIATANAPFFVGAKPVFADIEEKTYGLDPESVKEKITKKTKMIIPIHYGGCPCMINDLREISKDHGLILLEDAAEALGAKIGTKQVGSFGDASILSFCQNKIITTGEGGAIVTDSKQIYEKLKLIRSHGREEKENYFSSTQSMDYITLGYNFRMSAITAALGISQLQKINNIIDMRRKNAELLNTLLSGTKNLNIPNPPRDYFHVYQMYTIRVNNRDLLMNYLADKKIMTKIYFPPVHMTTFYKNKLGYTPCLPVTEKISQEVISLPIYPTLTKHEIEYITRSIEEFIKGEYYEK